MVCKAEQPVSVTSFNVVQFQNALPPILVNREQLDKSTFCKAEQLLNPLLPIVCKAVQPDKFTFFKFLQLEKALLLISIKLVFPDRSNACKPEHSEKALPPIIFKLEASGKTIVNKLLQPWNASFSIRSKQAGKMTRCRVNFFSKAIAGMDCMSIPEFPFSQKVLLGNSVTPLMSST